MILLSIAWMMVAFQQSGCAAIQDLTPQLFVGYLDYLLGEYVLRLYAKDEYGNTIGGTPWGLILSYEHEIRREAIRQTESGTPFGVALRAAWKDPVVKDRFFTTPLSLKRSRPPSSFDPDSVVKYARTDNTNDKGKGKGKGKGKVKGKGKGKGGKDTY